MKLFLGTGNRAKIGHYKRFLKDYRVELITPNDIGITDAPEETGRTIEENAVLKAKFYFKKSGLPTLADDAGFEIPALNNWPGVNSHRVNGTDAADEEIISAVITRMQDLKGRDRAARMKIVLALAVPGGQIKTGGGEIEGIVPERPYEKREAYFPYRSLLFVSKLNKWFYELGQGETDFDYRGQALEKLKPYLKNIQSLPGRAS